MRLKHNKKRNTAFVYEALIRELTKTIVKNNTARKKKVLGILTEFFNPSSILRKELDLYKTLYETTDLKRSSAEKLMIEAKMAYDRISKQEVFSTQTGLIKKINKILSPDVLNNFIPNYRNIATIYSIFNAPGPSKSKVLLEDRIVDSMSTETEKPKDTKVPIDNLVYKTFVQKFNEKYSDKLEENQKRLLSCYISSFADNGLELKYYLNEEIGRIKKELTNSLELEEVATDPTIKENMNKVLDMIESFKETPIDVNMVEDVLRIQRLTKEVSE